MDADRKRKDEQIEANTSAIRDCIQRLFPAGELHELGEDFDAEQWEFRVSKLERGAIRLLVARESLEYLSPEILVDRVRTNLPGLVHEKTHRGMKIRGREFPVVTRDDSEW